MTIQTDCRQVRILARDIVVMCKTMLSEEKELESELNRLKKTFGDDGIEHIRDCLGTVLDALDQCRTDMTGLTRQLMEYAAALEKTK